MNENLSMQTLVMFLPIVVMTVLYAAVVKLAARILRFSGVRWPHAFVFAILIVVLSAAIRAGSMYGGVQLPAIPGLLLGVILHVALGAWFFRSRATNQDGTAAGWLGGAKLCALTVGFLLMMGAGLLLIAQSLVPSA
jgi:hypothetical protein